MICVAVQIKCIMEEKPIEILEILGIIQNIEMYQGNAKLLYICMYECILYFDLACNSPI